MTNPTGYSLTQRKYAKSRRRTYGKCPKKAPCGNPCILNGNVGHEYHTCRSGGCQHCHGERFRYPSAALRTSRGKG